MSRQGRFKVNETIQALQRNTPVRPDRAPSRRNQPSQGKGSFSSALQKAQLQFSNHAQNRLSHRKINLSQEGLNRLSQAVEQAAQRGGRESLVLMDKVAYLVNVPERKVITALDTQNRRDNVFTQIDSVVLAERT